MSSVCLAGVRTGMWASEICAVGFDSCFVGASSVCAVGITGFQGFAWNTG